MNKRTLSILQQLCDPDLELTISGLAEENAVSERTIRNDLKAADDFLKENGLSGISIKNGGRIARESDISDILPKISTDDYYNYKLSGNERIAVACAMLTDASGYLTLSALADNLFVSRATVIHDLGEIKKKVRENRLEVISQANKGLRIEGRESDKRLFMMKLNRVSVQAGDRSVIRKLVLEQERSHASFLTEQSFNEVMLYLGVMVSRNMQGNYIERQEKPEDKFFLMAQDILKFISQYCHIATTEDEITFFSRLLSEMNYIRQKSERVNALKYQVITRRFIETVSSELGVNLNNDYEFFENLANHLESVFSSSAVFYQENAVISEVLEENPEVVRAVRKGLPAMEKYTGRTVSESEIGFIAVHVCAALERQKNKEVIFRVIVACQAGIGTSQLLMEKLKQHFNFRIVDVISAHEASALKEDAADFIISTVPLSSCRLEYVVVSPLLRDKDYIKVGNKIDALRNSRHFPSRIDDDRPNAKGMIEKLRPVVTGLSGDDAPELMKAIRKAVCEYFNQTGEEDTDLFSPYLHHLLPPEHIELDVKCKDWREAVRRSAEPLLKNGYIEERYIDAMISNIERNGPYIVISKGFAVPHEGLEQGSLKLGMNLIRLAEPVPFDADELDPVKFVCCLSAIDHKTHLKAFFNLVNMLKNGHLTALLETAKTSEEAALIIERAEYQQQV